jgi:hypothetical protein
MSEQRPTYQNALRAVGHFLDLHVYRHVLLCETADGFVIRALRGSEGDLAPDAIDLPLCDVQELIDRGGQQRDIPRLDPPRMPLCPTGYEDFLRSLGQELDIAGAILIRIVELSKGIMVSYTAFNELKAVQRFEVFYTGNAIEVLLAKAYARRVGPKPMHALPRSIKRMSGESVAAESISHVVGSEGR